MRAVSIIVVEDHDALRELTVNFLNACGHSARGAPDGETLDELLAQAAPEVVVLDVGLPGESGFEICSRLRSRSARLGIIMLTALSDIQQRVQGYDRGADIYLAKPTSQEELAAAVSSLGRRTVTDPAASSPLELDAVSSRISGPTGQAHLTESEVRILRGLALSSQRQLTYWQLLELLMMTDDADAKSALEVRVARLRRKLHSVGAGEPAIQSVRRVGYRLSDSWLLR